MRRIAAPLAIAFTATGAWAAVITWTGATDNDAGVASNWDANRFPNNDDAYFTNSGTYTDNEVVFTAACTNKWRTYVNNVGTAEAPLVFRATDHSYGLRFGNQGKSRSSYIGNSGAAYLCLKLGTWSASNLQLDEGQLSLTYGASLNVSADAFVNKANSKVAVTDGARFYTKRYFCHRAGEVMVENGTLEVADESYQVGENGDTSLLLNEGGLLIIKYIEGVKNSNTILFNGGTLRSNKGNATLVEDNSVITVKVGALGGTIDANTIAVSFPCPIAADGENDGGMTFKGGGSVTLKCANTYTGETKIAVRTKLVVTSVELARLLENGGIKVIKPEGVSAKGTFKLLGKSDGDCTAAEYALITKGTGLEGATFAIDEDGDITVTVSHTPQTWAGAAETFPAWSGNNWDEGIAFDDGNDAVFATDGAIAEVDDDFSAYTLTFNDNAALTGTGTLTVPTITVAEGKTASIAASLAGPIEKTGTGTLTLGSSRAGTATMLTEGTLVANAPVGTLTLGTDAAKPVTFDYGGQTYSSTYINEGLEVTLTNCTFSSFSRVANGTVHVAKNAMAYRSGWITVGPLSDETDTHAVLDICGGVVTNASTNIGIGDHGALGSSAAVRVRNGGLFATSNGIIVGSRAAATLTIDEGTVVAQYDILFCDSSSEVVSGEDSFLNLNAGGLLWVRSITFGKGAANATFTFSGGTLKANQDYTLIANKANMSVVTATSGTIDADGHAVTIAKSISGEGGMAYQGGGKVTFDVQPTYTGMTTVEVGTTLVIPEAIAGDMLAFVIPEELADGVYTVVSISGVSSEFAGDVLAGKAEGFVLSDDKKKICYVQGMDTSKPIYVGTDGNLSAVGNWLDGTVPTGGTGDAQIFCTVASTLTVGDTFAPAKLVIPDGSALVTIGSGTLCVGEVVNRQLLAVGTGATVVIGDQLTLGDGESICDHINGTLVVSNLLLTAEKGDRFVTEHQIISAPAVFKFDAVTNSMWSSWFYLADRNSAATNLFYIGKGGLSFLNASDSGAYCLGNSHTGCSTTIRPWYDDFTIADSGTGKYCLMMMRDVTFFTDDENGDGRTITIDAMTRARYSPKITVSGSGVLQVNSTYYNEYDIDRPVTVTDTATLAFGADASLGTGAITLGAGTTLALTATGREFTPLANTLNLPTEGVAKIRIDGARLKTGVHEIAIVGKGTSANVEPDLDGEALGGRRARFEVAEGGKLLLCIESNGMRIIIR